jgi:hypothetical protein
MLYKDSYSIYKNTEIIYGMQLYIADDPKNKE